MLIIPSASDQAETECSVFCKLNIISTSMEGTPRVIYIASRLNYWLIQ
jgi:hypothetical protein